MGKNAPLNMAAQSGYRGTFESVLTSCITVWYGNCSAADRKTLQQTVNIAAKIIGTPLTSILDIFIARCSSIVSWRTSTHPSHSLFQLLPSGRWYRSITARSARLLNRFSPQAVRALNSVRASLQLEVPVAIETVSALRRALRTTHAHWLI